MENKNNAILYHWKKKSLIKQIIIKVRKFFNLRIKDEEIESGKSNLEKKNK